MAKTLPTSFFLSFFLLTFNTQKIKPKRKGVRIRPGSLYLCLNPSLILFQGEYFNDEEVRMMLAREASEEQKRRIEEAEREELENEEARKEEGKRKKRGIIIAS